MLPQRGLWTHRIAVDVSGLLFVNGCIAHTAGRDDRRNSPNSGAIRTGAASVRERVGIRSRVQLESLHRQLPGRYHIPVVHPSLYRELDYANYRVETARYYSSQIAPLQKRNDPSGGRKERLYSDATGDAQALYYWMFPGWMLTVSIRTTCGVMR